MFTFDKSNELDYQSVEIIGTPKISTLKFRKLGLEAVLRYCAKGRNTIGYPIQLKILVTSYPLGKIRRVEIYDFLTGEIYNKPKMDSSLATKLCLSPPENIKKYIISFANENDLIDKSIKYADSLFKEYLEGTGSNLNTNVSIVCKTSYDEKAYYEGKSGETKQLYFKKESVERKFLEIEAAMRNVGSERDKDNMYISETNFRGVHVGNCAEVAAAINAIDKTGCTLKSIYFGPPIRPRTQQYVDSCENCTSIFPNL